MPFATKKLMAAISDPPAVIISFSGDQSTFTWATTDATAVSINNGIGSVALSGSMANPYVRDGGYKPAHSVTWILSASGGGVTVTQSLTVSYASLYPWYCAYYPDYPNCQ
jgi:hypothetical protein